MDTICLLLFSSCFIGVGCHNHTLNLFIYICVNIYMTASNGNLTNCIHCIPDSQIFSIYLVVIFLIYYSIECAEGPTLTAVCIYLMLMSIQIDIKLKHITIHTHIYSRTSQYERNLFLEQACITSLILYSIFL